MFGGVNRHVLDENYRLRSKVRGCNICGFHLKTLDLKKVVVEIQQNMVRYQHTVISCRSICLIEKVNKYQRYYMCLRKHLHIM